MSIEFILLIQCFHIGSTPLFKLEINEKDRSSWTPLHCACSVTNFEIILKLLKVDKIDVTARAVDGNTPLHYLVRKPPSDAQVNISRKRGESDIRARAREQEQARGRGRGRARGRAMARKEREARARARGREKKRREG